MAIFSVSVVDSNFAAITVEYGTTLDVLLKTKQYGTKKKRSLG